ncbi:MAG: epoxyqueuosine reductase [Oscillospiraceae bacterium]|nr:epoxyqueuosine reductase [Oscillospiraceae bacterium]
MERIRPVLSRIGIPDAGAVSFAGCLPLLECRAAERLPENAKTVIVCVFPYYTADDGSRNISRYAAVPDYHRVVGEMLEKACEELKKMFPFTFVSFADNSPIREVDAALRAGLGVLGRNSLLIHPVYGSWIFLGTIVTDMEMDAAEQEKRACIGCGACERACPCGCIGSAGIDAERCLSAVTQRKGELTPEEEARVKKCGLLWGCDICQEVCPMNRGVPETVIAAFKEDRKAFLTEADLTRAVRFRAYGFRGPGPLKRNYRLLYGEAEQ